MCIRDSPYAGYILRKLQDIPDGLGKLEVEHIYPQTPGDSWSAGSGPAWGDLSPEEQGEYRTVLNTLGNLTLLEESLNRGASNSSFAHKSARYYSQSKICWVKKELANLPSWDVAAIQTRNSELIDRFVGAWPRDPGAPLDIADDLVPVTTLPLEKKRGYPEVFEFAMCGDHMWGEVKTAKQLLVRVANEVRRRGPSLVEGTGYELSLIHI